MVCHHLGGPPLQNNKSTPHSTRGVEMPISELCLHYITHDVNEIPLVRLDREDSWPRKRSKVPHRKPAHERHDKRILMSVTQAEFDAFDEAARLAGVSRSSWIRQRCRDAARAELEDAGRPVPFLKRK